MLKKNDGFLLFESLLALFVLTIGILVMMETLLFLKQQDYKNKSYLELAIFSKEWQDVDTPLDKKYILKKATQQHINIIESGDDYFLLEKDGVTLEIRRIK